MHTCSGVPILSAAQSMAEQEEGDIFLDLGRRLPNLARSCFRLQSGLCVTVLHHVLTPLPVCGS